MLTKDQKEKWVAALRSGKYKQGRCLLKQGNPFDLSYCCIGVLFDLVNPLGWRQIGWKYFTYEDRGTMTHPFIAEEILLTYKQACKLTRMNDGEDCDFNQIANYIERNIPHAD